MNRDEHRFRQVWRSISDGTEEVKVLGLQVWIPAKEDDPDTIKRNGGYWLDVDVSTNEPPDNPKFQGE